VDTLNLGDGWYLAIDTAGGIRDGAWVAEATDLVTLDTWPAWNCGIANTPASKTASGKPKPPGWATCPATASTPTPPPGAANAAWREIALAAADLVAWAKLIGFTETPQLARCEIAAFRYRVLHVAARITRAARQTRLRIDATWRWAQAIATAWHRVRAAFP